MKQIATEVSKLQLEKASAAQADRLQTALCDGLPTLPAYLFELSALLAETPVDLPSVAQVIRGDPSLSSQVLRMCHAMPFADPVTRIEDAVCLVGVERLRAIALTCSLVESSQPLMTRNDAQFFWQHSLFTALLSERLAHWTGYPDPDKAYLAGLLHQIGCLPLLLEVQKAAAAESRSCVVDHLKGSVDPGDADPQPECECWTIGLDCGHAGRLFALAWNYPTDLAEVLEYHARPWQATIDPDLTGIVAVADQYAQRRGLGLVPSGLRAARCLPAETATLFHDCLPAISPHKADRLAALLDQEFPVLLATLSRFGGALRGNTRGGGDQ